MNPGKLPPPLPGEVIRYAYLWATEADDGQEEGIKDRPCAVVVTVRHEEGDDEVLVVPITSREPGTLHDGIELPETTRRRLGLQKGRCWILVSELNRFVWPGPDLRPVGHPNSPFYSYGLLPASLFQRIKASILSRARAKKLRTVPRSK